MARIARMHGMVGRHRVDDSGGPSVVLRSTPVVVRSTRVVMRGSERVCGRPRTRCWAGRDVSVVGSHAGDDGCGGSVGERMREIVAFAVPVLLVPIADPLMSLIDVIFLGQFSSSLNVAGLSPATLIFNFLFCTWFVLVAECGSLIAWFLGCWFPYCLPLLTIVQIVLRR